MASKEVTDFIKIVYGGRTVVPIEGNTKLEKILKDFSYKDTYELLVETNKIQPTKDLRGDMTTRKGQK